MVVVVVSTLHAESKEEQFKESGRMKVVRKGRAAIDAFCDKAEFVHVLEQGDTIYNAMLNYVRSDLYPTRVSCVSCVSCWLTNDVISVGHQRGSSWPQRFLLPSAVGARPPAPVVRLPPVGPRYRLPPASSFFAFILSFLLSWVASAN